MKQFQQSIDKLVGYAQAELGLTRKNADYVRNGIMEMLRIYWTSLCARL